MPTIILTIVLENNLNVYMLIASRIQLKINVSRKICLIIQHKKGIWMIQIKLLICPYQGNVAFGVTEINDVVRPAGNHVNGFDFIARNLK